MYRVCVVRSNSRLNLPDGLVTKKAISNHAKLCNNKEINNNIKPDSTK